MRGLFKKQDQTDRSRISDTQTQACNRLSASLLTDFMDSQADGNIVFSPYSIQMLLSLLIASTAGETRREVERYLCGTDDAAQVSEMVQLLQKMQTDFARSSTLGSANAVLADKSFEKRIRKEYVRLVERAFQGQVIASGDVVKDTNKWVREKTRGMIEQVLKEHRRNWQRSFSTQSPSMENGREHTARMKCSTWISTTRTGRPAASVC